MTNNAHDGFGLCMAGAGVKDHFSTVAGREDYCDDCAAFFCSFLVVILSIVCLWVVVAMDPRVVARVARQPAYIALISVLDSRLSFRSYMYKDATCL